MRDFRTDEGMFWQIVQTAPFVEADQLLRQRKNDAMDRLAEAKQARDGAEEARLCALLRRINDEIHRLNRVNRDYHMQLAIKALFGPDAWEQVKVWLMQNSAESR